MLELIATHKRQNLSTDSSPSSSSSEEGDLSSNAKSQRTRRRHKRRRHRSQKSASCRKVPPVPDLSPEEQEYYVAMDCEMVGVGPDGFMSVLARVTLLDWNSKVILDTLVRPEEPVTDYRTFVSGLTADDLLHGGNVMVFEACRNLVLSYIENKIVIGHGLKNDFHALQIYNHPWYLQRDTAKYEPFLQKEDDSVDTFIL